MFHCFTEMSNKLPKRQMFHCFTEMSNIPPKRQMFHCFTEMSDNIYNTLDSGEETAYNFRPMKKRTTSFEVMAKAEVKLVLCPTPSATPSNMFEILIGAWEGKQWSGLWKNTEEELVKTKTPGVLSADHFRGFWITVERHVIKVGRKGEKDPFMIHNDPQANFDDFRYYGYCTNYGSTGQWKFHDDNIRLPAPVTPPRTTHSQLVLPTPPGVKWVKCSSLSMCPNPMQVTSGPNILYIATAFHNNALLPGYVTAQQPNVCVVSWDVQVHKKKEFFLLSNSGGADFEWQSASNGNVPMGAIQGGYSEHGETHYVGRFKRGSLTLGGKVHPSHKVCYAPYKNQEVHDSSYEVLCL